MSNIFYKILSLFIVFILVIYISFDFKNNLDKFNNSYYSTTKNINKLDKNMHKHIDILKESIIFLHFNNDKISLHIKQSNNNLTDFLKNEDLKSNFPSVYKDILKYKEIVAKIVSKTYKFMRINSNIKNSLAILEKEITNIKKYDNIYAEKFLATVTKFMTIKNNFNDKNNITLEDLKFFENYKSKSNNMIYKINTAHIKSLYKNINKFKILFNNISNSNLKNIIANMSKSLEKDASKSKNNMQLEFNFIIIVYMLFFILVVSLVIKNKKETQKVIDLEKQKQNSLRVDGLTSLKNRNAFGEDMKLLKNYSVILLDITEFTNINTIAGYSGGDFIIKKIASILISINKKNIDYKDIYKVGVDQFAIVVENKNKSQLNSIALNIISIIENSKFEYNELDIPVYLQAGISQKKPFLKGAELAIIQTKNSFEKVSFFTEEIDTKKDAINNISMLKKVKEALNENRIRPFFQPLVDLKTKKTIKYEALVRLIEKDGKAISPFFFLELTKKSKLYPSITKLVINKSIELIKQENIAVSINISYQDIKDATTLNYISSVLQTNPKIAPLITFELLESEEIENYDEVFSFIDMIKRYGCKLAIDDFGSGYSNFTHLFMMKPDILKLDGSLIKDIHTNQNSRNIVEAMVILSKKSNIQTVAEFVDNEKVDDIITNIDIDFGQGYFYSPPKDLLN